MADVGRVEDTTDVGVLGEGGSEDGDGVEDDVEEDGGEGDGVGAAFEVSGTEGAPVALVILVASTFVDAGAPMVGGRAAENALEPGVS